MTMSPLSNDSSTAEVSNNPKKVWLVKLKLKDRDFKIQSNILMRTYSLQQDTTDFGLRLGMVSLCSNKTAERCVAAIYIMAYTWEVCL